MHTSTHKSNKNVHIIIHVHVAQHMYITHRYMQCSSLLTYSCDTLFKTQVYSALLSQHMPHSTVVELVPVCKALTALIPGVHKLADTKLTIKNRFVILTT